MLLYTVIVYQDNPNGLIQGIHVAFDIMKSWYKSCDLAALYLILQEKVMLCVANVVYFLGNTGTFPPSY